MFDHNTISYRGIATTTENPEINKVQRGTEYPKSKLHKHLTIINKQQVDN